jgi:hypothetical protein
MPGGRPTKYSPEIVELICERVATHDMGLRRLTDLYDDMPDKVTINIWRRKYPEFRSQYAQAKCEQIEFLTEDILDIADDSRNDWMESLNDDGNFQGYKVNGDHIQRCKLRVDTRKWLASKLAPKIYGDKKQEESNPQETLSKIKDLVNELNKTNNSDI